MSAGIGQNLYVGGSGLPSAAYVYNITPVGMDVKGGEAVHLTLDIQTQRCYPGIRSAK